MRISSYFCRVSWCSPAGSARANQDPYRRTIESVPISYCPISFRLLRHRVPSSRDPYRPNAHTRQMDSVGPGMPRAIEAAGPGPPPSSIRTMATCCSIGSSARSSTTISREDGNGAHVALEMLATALRAPRGACPASSISLHIML